MGQKIITTYTRKYVVLNENDNTHQSWWNAVKGEIYGFTSLCQKTRDIKNQLEEENNFKPKYVGVKK